MKFTTTNILLNLQRARQGGLEKLEFRIRGMLEDWLKKVSNQILWSWS